MVENPFEPAVQTTPEPAPEPAAPQTPPPVAQAPVTEQPETEVEVADEENLEQEENQFEELDEELTDIDESTDTIWLLRRVGVGILKTLLVLGGVGILVWLIWGGENGSDFQLPEKKLVVEREVEKSESAKEVVKKIKKPIFKSQKEDSDVLEEVAQIYTVESSAMGRSLSTWNYWMESQRISAQRGTPGDVLRWKKDVEVLFEIPFPQQISGTTSIARDHQVGRLLRRIESLMRRAEVLQMKLMADVEDFSARAEQARRVSNEIEQQFIESLESSNPVGISEILDRKIEQEKLFQQHSVDAEARQIFSQKVSEYQLTLENMQTLLVANRAAIVQDIRVVDFPADPFGRVISPGTWMIDQ